MDSWKVITSKEKEAFNRIADHLPKEDNDILIILKGHLLVEESLTEIINIYFNYPDFLENARLSFYQKIYIVKSIFGEKIGNRINLFLHIEELNKLRNKMVHKLDSKQLRNETINFIQNLRSYIQDDVEKFSLITDETYFSHLRSAIIMILISLRGLISGYLFGRHEARSEK